jgi:acetylornithine/succinyldiaminopimelate/putrescine aminotransferase
MSDAINKNRVLDLTRRYVAPHRVEVWDAFGTQLVMGRREGYRIWDLDGHQLIDLHLNGGTFNLGHRNHRALRRRGGERRGALLPV